MKKWKETLDGLVPLEYIRFKNVPMKESKHGPVIDLDPGVLDRLAAIAILRERIPLRGKELHFLRKVIGLSMERFAAKLGLSSGTIFHWEKSELERLATVNEVVVRSFVAEELGIELSGKFSELIGDKIHQIELKAG
jgi:DNA-binding XRE family transcriptional regulator